MPPTTARPGSTEGLASEGLCWRARRALCELSPPVPFSRRIPLWGGVLITIADTFVFLFLDKYGNFCSQIPDAEPAIQLLSRG